MGMGDYTYRDQAIGWLVGAAFVAICIGIVLMLALDVIFGIDSHGLPL
jgi:uncharacterized membrane protein